MSNFCCHCCRLMKTVGSVQSVRGRCLPIFAPSANISQVWIRILTTVKNVEYAGESTGKYCCVKNALFVTCKR